MKKISIIISGVFLVGALTLSGCAKTEYVTVTDTTTATTTLPVVTVTQTVTTSIAINESTLEQIMLADKGTIRIQGAGNFYYQRVDVVFNEDVLFQGITFIPYVEYLLSKGTTISGPVAYSVLVEFDDGTSEVLQYVGYTSDFEINMAITDHDSPYAGVLMMHDEAGETFMYFMVSET